MSDIKSLLDSIVKDTKSVGTYDTDMRTRVMPQTYDSGKFREKLSLYVLKDLVCAMMHDDTQDLNNMIDESIMRHIKNDYRGTCYGYLTCARDRLKSPILASVVQEIDDTVEDVTAEVIDKKDDVSGKIDPKEMLKNVENYEELRNAIKEQVSKQVVEDVSDVIANSNDAPTFKNVDEKLVKSNDEEINEMPSGSLADITNEDMDTVETESVILRICENIVMEAALNNQPMSMEDGFNHAIVEYCIQQLDFLTKTNPYVSIYAKYLK